ncbi:MAG: 4'-phosphopantetheinyl transferase superfamily protein [Lutimonas sp.]
MIGIDVIDLHQVKEFDSERRKRFFKKVFSEKEQHLIDSSPDVDLAIWRLWSMKESAYKILSRTAKERVFSPVKLNCEIFSESACQVYSNDQILFTRTRISACAISTVATNSIEDHFDEFLFRMNCKNYIEQRNIVYQKLKEKIAEMYQIQERFLSLKKNEIGVPFLYYKDAVFKVDFSLSHHGNCGFMAIQS